MISLAKVLSGKPIQLTKSISFYQPTLDEIVNVIGEPLYWTLLNIWVVKRSELIEQENEKTKDLDDYEIWKGCMMSSPVFREALKRSCLYLLKSKIEFFDISGTIYIGEKESGVVLDNTFYLLMKEMCLRVMPDFGASEEGEQYRENDHMSEREREMIKKMKLSAKKVEETKNPTQRPEDYLGNRITGLVAVGGYTFEQVYNMTMLQFNMLLQKCVDIQTFELRTQLSPYISSEDGQNINKFWLD